MLAQRIAKANKAVLRTAPFGERFYSTSGCAPLTSGRTEHHQGIETDFGELVPDEQDYTKRLIYIRQELRREGMKGVRRKTLPHVAAALLHISRGGQLDYHYVRSHYGYSERGSSKFITMLLRRGLLLCRGGRALFLTAAGAGHFPEGYFQTVG